MTKGNPGGLRGDCYNFRKSGHMARGCPEPRKEEYGNTIQEGEYAQMQLNLTWDEEGDTYIDVEGFDMF